MLDKLVDKVVLPIFVLGTIILLVLWILLGIGFCASIPSFNECHDRIKAECVQQDYNPTECRDLMCLECGQGCGN